MKTNIYFSALLISALSIFGCTKDQKLETPTNDSGLTEAQRVQQIIHKDLLEARSFQGLTITELIPRTAQFITVPAGSSDAIAAAIKSAGTGGVVYLKAGTHTESLPITIRTSVTIIGEDGSTLKIKSPINPPDSIKAVVLTPAFHVLNAPQTAFLNLTVVPVDSAGGGFALFENSPQSALMYNTLNQFSYGAVVEGSDQIVAIGNHIISNNLWKTKAIRETMGILNINGKSAYIARNEIENFFAGIFVSDQYGSMVGNNMHEDRFALVTCGYGLPLRLPNGNIAATKVQPESWKILNNQISNSSYDGIGMISGTKWSVVQGNIITGSGIFDYDLGGDTHRFQGGRLLVATHDNTITASSGQTIKDCGNNNTVIGGTLLGYSDVVGNCDK